MIQFYLNNTINLRHLSQRSIYRVMPTTWRSYREHRLCVWRHLSLCIAVRRFWSRDASVTDGVWIRAVRTTTVERLRAAVSCVAVSYNTAHIIMPCLVTRIWRSLTLSTSDLSFHCAASTAKQCIRFDSYATTVTFSAVNYLHKYRFSVPSWDWLMGRTSRKLFFLSTWTSNVNSIMNEMTL